MGLVPFPSKIQDEIIPVVGGFTIWQHSRTATENFRQLPFWVLVSFGAYLLFKLGWGVFTFNDVPEAHKELMAQIETAKKELRGKGVEVD